VNHEEFLPGSAGEDPENYPARLEVNLIPDADEEAPGDPVLVAMAELHDGMAELRELTEELLALRQEEADALSAARLAMEQLDKQVSRAGKELFRTNTQADTQLGQVKAMLDQVRETEKYRDRHLDQLRRELETARTDGKAEALGNLLPILDGLEEALAAGERLLLPFVPDREGRNPPSGLSFGARLLAAWRLVLGTYVPGDIQPGLLKPEALAAWLHGLELLQARVLDTLAGADIHPMETENQAFDPHLHIAFETAPVSGTHPSGTIVREIRTGYYAGAGILRCAEVVVAK